MAIAFMAATACSDGGGPSTPKGRIAFARDTGAAEEIYVMRGDGSGLTNLTNSPGGDEAPAWSPDGSTIAFISNRTGQFELYVMDTTGGHQTQVTHNSLGNVGRPTWSPDGTRLMYSVAGLLILIAPDGSDSTRIETIGGTDPAWHPQADRIALGGGQEVRLIDPDGTHPSIGNCCTSGLVLQSSWSPGGNRLTFANLYGGLYSIFVSDTDGSGELNLTIPLDSSKVVAAVQPTWSPDGSVIAFTCNVSKDQLHPQYDLCLIHPDGSQFQKLTTTSVAETWPAWAP